MILPHGTDKKLLQVGIKNAEQFRLNEIRLTCPFHDTLYPDGTHSKTAFLIGDKNMFYCFSCHKTLSFQSFEANLGVKLGLEIEQVGGNIVSFVQNDYDEVSPTQSKKYRTGLNIFNEAGDYRLFPNVVNYFKKRLGFDFKLPPYLKVKYHEERNTVLFKGHGDVILERFPKDSQQRFKIYELKPSLMYFNPKPTYFVVVVEGMFDALKVYQLGFTVVCLLTNTISSSKLAALENLVQSGGTVLSLLDGDMAGKIGTEELKSGSLKIGRKFIDANLSESLKKVGANNGNFKDPGEIPYEILREILEHAKNPGKIAVGLSYSEIF